MLQEVSSLTTPGCLGGRKSCLYRASEGPLMASLVMFPHLHSMT